MSAPLTYQRIEDGICEGLRRQESLLRDYAEAGDALARAEADYRQAFAASRITARCNLPKPTVDIVDDSATIATEAERLALEVARSNHEVTRQALYAVRERLQALRSLLVSHRDVTGG